MDGMFSSAPQKPQQKSGYSGIVNVKGEKVLASNGKAEYNGEIYRIYGNGEAVVDSKDQIIGYIDNQTFRTMDEAYLNKLKKMGIAQ
jgi:hypothetical protein